MPYIWSIVEDDANHLWLAGFRKPLNVWDGKEFIKKISIDENQFYFGALKDNKNNLLFPMHSGIAKYADGKIQKLNLQDNHEPPVNLVLFEDKERNLLFSGVRKGIRVFRDYTEIGYWGEKEGVHPCTFIQSIGKDKNQDYWLGSFQGLSRFDWETKQFFIYTKENEKLPYSGVITTFCDSNGNMWFGGTGGLATYDYEKDSIFLVAPNVFNDYISFITNLDSTHLLIGVINGLYVLDLAAYYDSNQVNLKHYNHRNGYLGVEPTQSAVLKDSKGFIWVASSSSIDKIDPKHLDLGHSPIATNISQLNKKKLPFGIMKTNLPKGENKLEFRFEAVGFNRPLQTQYAYKLEKVGQPTKWSEWRADDFAVFSKLSSGGYTFSVKSRQGSLSNDSSSKIASMAIKITLDWWKEPHFFKTAFVVLGVSSLLIAMLIASNYVFQSKAEKNLLELEMQKKANAYLQNQTTLAQMNPHFMFNVLQNMQGLIFSGDWKKADDYLVQLSKLIRRFLEATISGDGLEWQKENDSFTLEQEIELLTAYVSLEQQLPRNSFEFHIEKNGIDTANYDIPPMLIQPFAENAIKHGLNYKQRGEKRLLIEFSLEEDENILCVIEDTGVGRAEAKRIQEKSYSTYKSQGTKLVERRVAYLNELGFKIKIDTKDRIGGGTIVALKISGSYDY